MEKTGLLLYVFNMNQLKGVRLAYFRLFKVRADEIFYQIFNRYSMHIPSN